MGSPCRPWSCSYFGGGIYTGTAGRQLHPFRSLVGCETHAHSHTHTHKHTHSHSSKTPKENDWVEVLSPCGLVSGRPVHFGLCSRGGAQMTCGVSGDFDVGHQATLMWGGGKGRRGDSVLCPPVNKHGGISSTAEGWATATAYPRLKT